VAIPKVCGIETEYGIAFRGSPDGNPVVASSMLVNAYVEHRKVGWDFEDESPGRDARGFAREDASPPEVETHLVNTVLTNGARYYVDHAHPEFSTPEGRLPSPAPRAGDCRIQEQL
jgi:proteasome accessory factor A